MDVGALDGVGVPWMLGGPPPLALAPMVFRSFIFANDAGGATCCSGTAPEAVNKANGGTFSTGVAEDNG